MELPFLVGTIGDVHQHEIGVPNLGARTFVSGHVDLMKATFTMSRRPYLLRVGKQILALLSSVNY